MSTNTIIASLVSRSRQSLRSGSYFVSARWTVLLTLCLGLLAVPAGANTLIWNGGAGNGSWNNSANWFGAGIPANGDSLVFQGAVGLVTSNNIASLTLNQIRFLAGGFDIKGNAFTLTNSIMATNAVGNNTIENSLTLTTADVTVAVTDSLQLSGNVGGAVGLIKTGPGSLTYAGSANAYAGTTRVNGGTLLLQCGALNAAFGGPLIISDGSASATVKLLYDQEIPNGQPITINGLGVLDLNNLDEDISGSLTLNNGGSVNVGTAPLTLVAPSTITVTGGGSIYGTGTLQLGAGPCVMNVASGSLIVSTSMQGAAAITKTGGGNLYLYGTNTYTGLTTVSQGWLWAENAAALGGTSSGTVVTNGATLVLDGGIVITNEALTLAGLGANSSWGALDVENGINTWTGPVTVSANTTLDAWVAGSELHIAGPISGAGGLELFGSGSHYFEGSAANTYAGTTTVDAPAKLLLNKPGFDYAIPANLVISGSVKLLKVNQIANASDVTVNVGGLLDIAAAYEGIDALSGGGNVSLSGGYLVLGYGNSSSTFTGLISGGNDLQKEGSGTITLSGNNSYTGNTTINSGGLIINGVQPQSSVTVNSGTTLGGAGTVGLVTLNAGAITTGTAQLQMTGDIYVTASASVSPIISGNIKMYGNTITVDNGAVVRDLQIPAKVSDNGSGFKVVSGATTGAFVNLTGSNSFTGPLTVSGLTVTAETPWALGSTSGGTTVTNSGELFLFSCSITNESVTLAAGTTFTAQNPCSWYGPVVLAGNATINNFSSPGMFDIVGPISGIGNLTSVGSTNRFSGAAANTYVGTTTVSSGQLVLNKSGGNIAVPGNLVINSAATARLAASAQTVNTADVLVNGGGTFDFSIFNTYMNTLRGTGTVNFGIGGWIYIGLNNGTSQFDGSFTGTGYAPGWTVGKTGSGTFTMNGNSTYTAGLTEITGGKLVVNGSQPLIPVLIDGGATLGGTGTVGAITANGSIAPGNSPGILNSSNVTFGATGNLTVELTGPAPGSAYDQLNVTGTATLASAALTVVPAFTTPATIGQKFTILNNDAAEACSGIFSGLAEGATLTTGGYKFTISYIGGTGNDVVLTLTSLPGAVASVAVTSGDGSHSIDPNECNSLNLVITNQTGTPMTGINASLSAATPGVFISQPASTYANIAGGGKGTNVTPFQISTLPSFVCGTDISLQLTVNSSLGSFTMNYVVPTGSTAVTPLRYDNNVATAIPDVGTALSTNVVSGFGSMLKKVAVSLWLTHPIDSDLSLSLIAPDGTTVPLVAATGGGANFGSGSADANRTTFDDAAATAIAAGSPPFVGTFRPQGNLANYIGNATPNGNWRLQMTDGFGGSLGTLRNWSLFLYPVACGDGGGQCDLCPNISFSTATGPSTPFQNGYVNPNSVASVCGVAKACPGIAGGSYPADNFTFHNGRTDACITVTLENTNTSFGMVVAAYSGSYNPTNVDRCASYLADAGFVVGAGYGSATRSFSFNVASNATFVVNVLAGSYGPYKLTVYGGDCSPALNITALPGNQARLSWPTWAGGYKLEAQPSLSQTNWTFTTNEPIVTSLKYSVTNSASGATNRFYRLHKP